jgi:hypothetical protein
VPCPACGRINDPATRQAAQNTMGPWAIARSPGIDAPAGLLSYDALAEAARSGVVTESTPVRGPTTRQLWKPAIRVPGLAHLLGRCHNCNAGVELTADHCPICDADFAAPTARQDLGLAVLAPLPGQADAEHVAAAALMPAEAASTSFGRPDAPKPPISREAPPAKPELANLRERLGSTAGAAGLAGPPSPTERARIGELERSLRHAKIGIGALLTVVAGTAVTIALLVFLPDPSARNTQLAHAGATAPTSRDTIQNGPTGNEIANEQPPPADTASGDTTEEPAEPSDSPPGAESPPQSPGAQPASPSDAAVPAPEPDADPKPAPTTGPERVTAPTQPPLDALAEPYRARIEAALARARDAIARSDESLAAELDASLNQLVEIQQEITAGASPGPGDLLILDHHIADLRSRLVEARLDDLLSTGE